MNYIKQLQADVANRDAQIAALVEGLSGLRSYMLSSKFHGQNPEDGMVNTADILRWIDATRSAQADAEVGIN